MAKKTETSRGQITFPAAAGNAEAEYNASAGGTRRPSQNPAIPQSVIDTINTGLNRVKAELEPYAAHLRALDRRRLNSIKEGNLGFVERSYALALENPEFLPRYMSTEKLTEDHQLYLSINSLAVLSRQIGDYLRNIEILAADMDYTNNLEFYKIVQEAAKRRVDGAETIFRNLKQRFKHKKHKRDTPTLKEQERDVKAIIHGTKDGKFIVENKSPHLTKGQHRVIDETYNGKIHYKDTKEEEIQD
jgi:hypothetical protein